MKTKFYYLAFLVLIQLTVKAQMKIGDNSTTINSASLLELETTDKGLVLPRVSLTNVNSSSPLSAGLLTSTVVYNTNSGTTGGSGIGIYYWDGTKWNFIANTSITSNYWSLTGNSGTNASTNFIGTLDATDFVARTANTERMRILGAASGSSKAGWIGMGVTIPRSSLDVTGHFTNKNVLTIENSSTSGFSSVDMMDSAGNLKGTFGYANSGTGGLFAGKDYFNIYGNDFIFTTNSSAYDFFMKGSSGFIGLNTNTPSERLHVVGNFYLTGAFMPNGLPGTSGYVLTSAGAATSPTWSNLNNLSWGLTGNSGTSYATNFLGTTDNVSLRLRTNNVQRMIIDSTGKVGIGLNNPGYSLSVLSSSNPLYLSGVQATSTFTTDSLLTINAGVVKKAPYSSLTGNFWSITGNSGTNYATNFIGTSDNISLRFRTNNTERMVIDSTGSIGIGSTNFNTYLKEKFLVDYGNTTSNNIASFKGNINDYLQIGVQNTNSGSNASSDIVATSDDGTDSTNYIDMGINSSTYAPTVDNFGGPHDGYLYTYSRNLLVGTAKTNADIIFLLGGGQTKFNAAMRMDAATGNIIIGKGENNTNATGNIIRAPNGGNGTNIPGGSLTLQGGASNGSTAGGNLNLYGGSTVSGTYGSVNINASTNSATNINTGTSTGTITLGNSLNNINLPKLSATSVVLTDASKNLTSTTPSNNTYLYYNGTNFTWATAASSLASLTNGSGITSLNYNGSSAATVSLANGTAAGQVYVTGASPFTPSLVTMSGDATINSAGALSLATVNGNIGTFNNVTVNAKGLVTAASNVAYTTLGNFSATAPLTYNSATGAFAISQANTSTNGYLSSTDWNTFNNKVGSITLNTPSSVFSNPINFSVTSGAATGTLSLNTQTANTVFAGPTAGAAAAPTFRALVAADIPSLAGSYIQNQSTQQASSNFNISGNGTIGTNLSVTGTSTLTGLLTSNGGHTNSGTFTTSGGIANINASSNFATNINTGTSTSNVTIGNSSNNILLPKFNTTGGFFFTAASTGQLNNTSTDMTWDDVNHRLGIGITAPAYKLSVLAASNPLYLSGVQATSTFTADSVLTINAGVVKKTPYSSLPSTSNWSLTGNSGTTAGTNFIGTTDATDFVTSTNNTERVRVTSSGNVGIGTNNPQQSLSVNNGMNIDQGNANTGSTVNTLIFGSNSGEAIGSKRNSGGDQYGLDFYTSYNNRMVITNSGTVGIGITTPNSNTSLDVNGSFKLGSNGTVTKNSISFSSTLSSTTVAAQYSTTTVAGTVNVVTLNANTNYIDVTFTLPSAASSTQAAVIVSPSFDLSDDIVISFARLTSTTQGKVRFMNVGTASRTFSGTLYITVTDF